MNGSDDLNALRKASTRAALMSFAGVGVLVVTLIYTGLKIRAAQRELEQTADRLSSTKQEFHTTEAALNQTRVIVKCCGSSPA